MAEHIIEVRVDEKIASVVGDPLYVCGNSDYIVKFSFDAEWAGHETKTARFIKSNKEYIDVLFAGNQCAVPIIDNTPYVRIGVFAGNLCTTTAAIINAQRSILCGSGVPADPEPDIYAQIMERFNMFSSFGYVGTMPVINGIETEEHLDNIIDLHLDVMPKHSTRQVYANLPYKGISIPWHITIHKYLNSNFAQIDAVVTSSNGLSFRKLKHSGSWGASEEERPRMRTGVEYRTTERSGGSPVYRKRIVYTTTDIGTAGHVTSVSIPHDITGFGAIISVNASIGNNALLPHMDGSGNMTCVAGVSGTAITLRTMAAWSGERTWTFDLSYTKS